MNCTGTFYAYKTSVEKECERASYINDTLIPSVMGCVKSLVGEASFAKCSSVVDISRVNNLAGATDNLDIVVAAPSLKVPEAPEMAIGEDTRYLSSKLEQLDNCRLQSVAIDVKAGKIHIKCVVKEIK